MFTLGREREKRHARQNIKSQSDAVRIEGVVEAVHDVLDGIKAADDAEPVLTEAFTKGGAGVWEQTGSWLLKLSNEHAGFGQLWRRFCNHPSATVRFRAAAFLREMPADVFRDCFPRLLADASARVRAKTASEQYGSRDPLVRDVLSARLAMETDATVRDAINFALKYVAQ